jgi:hypothetical protein
MTATAARRVRSIICTLALAAASGMSLADVPAAFDRIPEGFEGVIAVPSIEKFETQMEAALKSLPTQPGSVEQMQAQLDRLAGAPGVNRKGSIAAFVMPLDAAAKAAKKTKDAAAEGQDEDGFANAMKRQQDARDYNERNFVLVPVTDYKAFVEGLQGDASQAVTEIQFTDAANQPADDAMDASEPEKAFARDIGGGYALLGFTQDRVAAFKPVEGKLAAHTTFVGAVGQNIAKDALLLVVGNIAEMKDMISSGFSDLDKNPQVAMATMGAGEQAKKGLQTVELIANNFARDARVGIIGMGLDDKGVWIDLASQFNEGTELAGFFQDKGNVQPVLTRLPSQTFVAMIAMDTAGSGMKKLMSNIAKQGGEDAAGMISALSAVDKVDGYGWMMGASPAGLMGLFSSTSSFTMVKDPQAYLTEVKKSYEAMNGKTISGLTFKTTYTPAASTIEGIKVDSYTVTQTADPNNQEAQQALMMQGMMGGGGPSAGMYAPVEGGVVATYSKNNLLMKEAITTAGNAQGVASADEVKMLQAYLPADRTMEGYIGVKPVMEMALGAMMMFGMEMDVQLPEKISPVAFGATTNDGAFRARIFIPHDVLTALGQVGESMQQGMQQDMMPGAEEEEGQAPGF